MYRGTTPQHTFELPEELATINLSALYITYSQFGQVKIEKSLNDDTVTRNGNLIVVQLTQEETLNLIESVQKSVYIQVRLKTEEGTVIASDILKESVGEILKDGVI